MAKNEIGTSLVILNYNDAESTRRLVSKIENYNTINHIIVVDNHSSDGSFTELKETFELSDKVIVIKTDQNGGYAYGNNFGCNYAIQKLGAEYLTVANPDVFFEEASLQNMLTFYQLNRDRKLGIISCMMNCVTDKNLPTAWKLPRYGNCIMECLLILKRLVGDKTRYTDWEDKEEAKRVDVVAGSFFMISREAYEEVKGFDEKTFLYYEENILASKLKRNGYVNYIIKRDEYVHMHSVSIDKTYTSLKTKLDIANRSRLLYLKEYLDCNAVQLLIAKVMYYIGRFDYLLVKRITAFLRRNVVKNRVENNEN